MPMKKLLAGLGSLAIAALAATAAHAQDTVKIGVIMAYSGPFADLATQMDNGIKLYMKQKGDTVAGKKIEIIRKDTGGSRPTSPPGSRRSSSPATRSISWPASRCRRTRSRYPRFRPTPRSSW